MIRLLQKISKKRRVIKKEKEQAFQLMRDEALNNGLLNSERKPGDVEEEKHPYKVVYYEDGGTKGMSRVPVYRKAGRKPREGMILKVTEYSRLSEKAYMFRKDEILRVGSKYGKTGILAGNPGVSDIYFEIIPRNNEFYIKSGGNAGVKLSRGKRSMMLDDRWIALCENDCIAVTDKVYEVSFV